MTVARTHRLRMDGAVPEYDVFDRWLGKVVDAGLLSNIRPICSQALR